MWINAKCTTEKIILTWYRKWTSPKWPSLESSWCCDRQCHETISSVLNCSEKSKSQLGIFRRGTKRVIIPLHISIYAHFECSTDHSHLKISRLKLKKIGQGKYDQRCGMLSTWVEFSAIKSYSFTMDMSTQTVLSTYTWSAQIKWAGTSRFFFLTREQERFLLAASSLPTEAVMQECCLRRQEKYQEERDSFRVAKVTNTVNSVKCLQKVCIYQHSGNSDEWKQRENLLSLSQIDEPVIWSVEIRRLRSWHFWRTLQ